MSKSTEQKAVKFIERPEDAITLNQAVEVIKNMSVGAGLPVILWGPPGIGKTERIKELFLKDLGYDELRQIIVAWEDPTTGKGMPMIRKIRLNGTDEDEIDVTRWAISDVWAVPHGKKVAYFFDELPNATPALTSIFQKIIHEKKVGGIDISDCPIVAAGNDTTHAAGTFKLSSAMANRFIHLNIWPSVDEFVEYAVSQNFHEWVTAYTRFQVKHPKPLPGGGFADPMVQFDPSRNEKSFLSPRTIEYASKILQSGMSDKMKRVTVEGAAGKWYASELFAYSSVFSKIPDIDAILAGNDIEIPKAPDIRYATISTLIGRLMAECGSTTDIMKPGYTAPPKLVTMVENSLDFAWKLAEQEDAAEFSVVFLKDVMRASNMKLIFATKNKPFEKDNGAFSKLSKKFASSLVTKTA